MKTKNTKIRRKKGFTLVECVVAMAVLMVMSLLLAMILSTTVMQRNKNMEIERAIDEQVDRLVMETAPAEVSLVTEAFVADIDFGDGIIIPGNNDANVSVNKKHYEDEQVNIGQLEYEFNDDIFGAVTTTGIGGPSPTPSDPDHPVSGAANISSLVINETTDGDVVTAVVSFTMNSAAKNKTFKLEFKQAKKIISTNVDTWNGFAYSANKNTVVFQSANEGGNVSMTATIKYKK